MKGLEERAQEFEQLLWVHSMKGQIKTPGLSRILENCFEIGGMPRLGLRHWRQASVAIADAYLKDYEGKGHSLDLQRGHTSWTSNLMYGGTSGHSIDRAAEWEFMMTSRDTQAFWGVSLFPSSVSLSHFHVRRFPSFPPRPVRSAPQNVEHLTESVCSSIPLISAPACTFCAA